jgi:integrase
MTVDATAVATPQRTTLRIAESPKRQRTRRDPDYMYERTSRRTGVAYWYGDFRRFADVGGRLEALIPAGSAIATSDQEEARLLYAERVKFYRAIRTGQQQAAPVKVRVPRLGPVAVEHLLHKAQVRKAAKGTVERDEDSFKVLTRLLGNVPISQITTTALFDYVQKRSQEPGTRHGTTTANQTIRNELHALSSLFQFAIDRGYVSHNPVRRFASKPSKDDDEAFYLTELQAATLLDAAAELDAEVQPAYLASRWRAQAKRIGDARCDPTARELRSRARAILPHKPAYPNLNKRTPFLEALIATFLYTGGRRTEVLGLLVRDVDFDNGLVHIRPNRHRGLKKKRHQRAVRLWAPLAPILREHVARFALTQTDLLFAGRSGSMLWHVNRPLDLCSRQVNVAAGRRVTPHTLRHTFATMLLQTLVPTEAGGWAVRSSFEVAKQLGHTSSRLVDQVYGHLVASPTYRQQLTYEKHRRRPAMAL